MKLIKEGIILDPKKNKTNSEIEMVSDEIIDRISEQIEKEYADTFKLLSNQND